MLASALSTALCHVNRFAPAKDAGSANALRPRVLVNVSNVDTSTNVMGYDCAFPAYMSAVALQKLGHPLGELNWARAAKTCNVLPMFPTLASCR